MVGALNSGRAVQTLALLDMLELPYNLDHADHSCRPGLGLQGSSGQADLQVGELHHAPVPSNPEEIDIDGAASDADAPGDAGGSGVLAKGAEGGGTLPSNPEEIDIEVGSDEEKEDPMFQPMQI